MPKKFLVLLSVLILISSYLSILVSPVSAYYTTMPASVVIGQPDFVSSSVNQGGSVAANTINSNGATNLGVYYDPGSNKLFVADVSNNRVLIFNGVPTSNNASADIVIGQQDFTHNSVNQGGSAGANTLSAPYGINVINSKLFIVDQGNHRVLIFNSIPTSNNASADLVIGQTDLVSVTKNQCNCNTPAANTLFNPANVVSDGQKLFISDESNNRVLIYNSIPTSNNASANVVLGQSDFTTQTVNQGGIGANTLNVPSGIVVAENKLLVGDVSNARVLIWNTIPTVNKAPAEVVIGQTNFTSNGNPGAPNNIRRPFSLTYDGKRLFIAHDFSGVVSIRNGIPTANFSTPDVVLGEFGGGVVDAIHLHEPRGLTIAENKLIVADIDANRILIFTNTTDTPQLNITTPLEMVNGNTLRVRGSIQLGDRPNYAMQWIKADINGSGLGYITSLGGGRDNGTNQTLYDFFHEFNPFVNGGNMTNFTMKLVASSFNADSTSLFYFQPFNFDYIRKSLDSKYLNISFFVNTLSIQRVKDNVDHFEVQTSTDSGKTWKQLTTNITTDKLSDKGQIYLTISNTLLPKTKYAIKIIAVSKDSNWQQSSNILSYFVPAKKSVK